MATVKSVLQPTITAQTPFAYTTPKGVSGFVTTTTINETEVVVMVFDDAVDQIGKDVTVKHPIDMSDYWTLDLDYNNNQQGDFHSIGTMQIEFGGQNYTLQLLIYFIDSKWWLIRKASDGEYAASGKNILSNFSSSYTLPDGILLADIESSDTGNSGLEAPTNFPSTSFLAILGTDYEQAGNAYKLKTEGTGGGTTTPPDSNTVDLTSKTETGYNTTDLSAHFKASWDYSKFKAMAAFQWPTWRGQSGLLEQFKAGWNFSEYYPYYPTSYSLGASSNVRFTGLQWDDGSDPNTRIGNIYGAARQLPSEYADLKNNVLQHNFAAALTQPVGAWEQLGGQLVSHILDFTELSTGANLRSGAAILDVETYPINYTGTPNEAINFMAKCAEYITKSSGIVIHYGYYPNTIHSSNDMRFRDTNVSVQKNEAIMGAPKPSNTYYFDGFGSYVKSPLPISSTLYKKDTSGNYILSGGKRQLRTDPFSETLFGVKNTWHPSFYNPYSENYDLISDGNGDYIGGMLINPATGVRVTDVEFAVAWCYKYVTTLKLVMGNISREEGHGFDVTRFYESVYKPILVMSMLTEPFMIGGQFFRRWEGEEQIKFKFLAALFCGYDGVYTYEDGFVNTVYYNPDFNNPSNLSRQLPTKGNKFNPWFFFENYADFNVPFILEEQNEITDLICDQNYSRYNWVTTAIAVMRDIMSYYTKNNTLRFLHFNPIGGGIDNREVIMEGMYQGANMHILCYYPFQDVIDMTQITFTIGGNTYTQNIRPRKVEIFYFSGSFSSLNPVDIKAQYNNIDGTLIKVTGDPDNHTW